MNASDVAALCDVLCDPADEEIWRGALRGTLRRLAAEFRSPVIALCDYHGDRRVIDALHLCEGELLSGIDTPAGRAPSCTPRLSAELWRQVAIQRSAVLDREFMERRAYPNPELLAWYAPHDYRGWIEIPIAVAGDCHGKLSLMHLRPDAPGFADAVAASSSFRILRALWLAGRRAATRPTSPTRPTRPMGRRVAVPPRAVRVLLVDDHAMVLDGLAAMLRQEPRISVVGREQSGAGAVAAYRAVRPDVVVMDVDMPGIDGIEALRRILADDPAARVVMLTAHARPELLTHCTEAGARGFLLKGGHPGELVEGIRRVADGGNFLGAMARNLVGLALKGPRVSPREHELLPLVAAGQANKEIAHRLRVSEETVKDHLRTLFRKFDVHSRVELVGAATRAGLLRAASGVITRLLPLATGIPAVPVP